MEVLQIRLSLLVCILLCALCSSQGLRIGFGELDYAADEGDMVANIELTSLDPITENITIPIQVLTYDEFYRDMGRSLSADFDTVDIPPDPAEYSSDPAERRDFMRSGQILVTISAGTQDQQVAIPLIDDDINEASEGFFVVVVEDDIAIPETSVELVRDGVTLVRIEDDDLIPISFEETAYSFQELEMLINSVLVGKEDVVTEQNLTLLVQLSTNGVAREGEDFILENSVTLTFSPEDETLPVPFQILGDLIPEDSQRENFRLSLAISEVKPGLTLGTNVSTVISIIDNDIASIGFDQDTYTVNEDEGSVTVCIEVKDPAVIDLLVTATLQTQEGTATEMEDFMSPFPNFLVLNSQSSSSCFDIPIVNDNDTDPGEEFTVSLERIPLFTAANVEFSVPEATIRIIDDESPQADPTTEAPAPATTPSPPTARPTTSRAPVPTKATPMAATRKPRRRRPTKPTRKPRPNKKPRRMRKPPTPANPNIRLHNILTAINQGRRRPAPPPPQISRPSPRPVPVAADPCQAADVEMSGTKTSGTKSTTTGTSRTGTKSSKNRSKRMSSKGTKSKSMSGQADEAGAMCAPAMDSSSTGSSSSSSSSSSRSSRSSSSRSSSRSSSTRSTTS